MSTLDTRLKYSRATGISLDYVNTIADFPEDNSEEATEYVQWLEEQYEKGKEAISILDSLERASNALNLAIKNAAN